MKKLKYVLIALLVSSLPGKSLLADTGDIINIKFGGSPVYRNGAAINDIGGQTWNSFSATDQDEWAELVYSNNGETTASIMYNMTGTKGLDTTGTAFLDGNIDKPLMRGYVSTDASNTGIINLQGLAAGSYDLYMYSQIDKNLTSNLSFSANGVAGSLTNNGSLTSISALTQNQNWLVRQVTVGNNGLLNIDLSTNSQINGLQLLQTSDDVNIVPEPTTILLLGTGGMILFSLRKKRTASESEFSIV